MIKLYTDLHAFPSAILPPIVELSEQFVYVDTLSESEYVLLPHWEVVWEYTDKQYRLLNLNPSIRASIQQSVQSLISLASAYQKKIIVVHWSDSDKDIPLENAIILKTSLYKSSQKPHVFAYPSWRGDLKDEFPQQTDTLRIKKEKPSVGFRGSALPLRFSLENLIRSKINFCNTLFHHLSLPYQLPYGWNQGQQLRRTAMKKLMSNGAIHTDFTVLTRGYISQKDPEKKQQNRQLFINNIMENDYILCIRGAGNYSFRLYETLSAGRIPLFINTDCVLPYDFMIDWKKYCVWVEEKDIDRIDQILLDFHQSLSREEFMELQIHIRTLWNEWIRPKGFFTYFHQHLLGYESFKEGLDALKAT